jgi:peptidoglycan/xylan/chitin deacetylase (PgdA/CDA1 family)
MKAILTYHSLDTSGSPISVTPDAFARHVRWLASGAARVIPLSEIATHAGDEDVVAITFDDAIDNFASVAVPLLTEHALPVTVFVVSGHAGGTNAWSHGADVGIPRFQLLGWDSLGRLRERGVTLGAHTRSHPHLTQQDAAELVDEIAGCADDIERFTGFRPTTFAYPYGSVNAAVANGTRRHYECACTTRLAMVTATDDPMWLPRLDAFYFQKPGTLESWGSPRFRAYVGARAFARRVRSGLRSVGELG